jgi:transposase
VVAIIRDPGVGTLKGALPSVPAGLSYWVLLRMVRSGQWDAQAVLSGMSQKVLRTLPPPADGRLYLIGDTTHKTKRGRQHSLGPVTRHSETSPYTFGFGMVVWIASWAGCRIPVALAPIAPKRKGHQNILFRQMLKDFEPPAWVRAIIVGADAGYAANVTLKLINDLHWTYVFAMPRTRKFTNGTCVRDMVQHLPTIRALEQLVEHRRRVVGDKVRITNRLTSTLKNYFPHALPWFQDKDTAIFRDFLSRWPTLKAVHLARRATLETFFRAHHVRYADVIAQRLQAIKAATPLTTDAGVIAPNALLVQVLVAQLRVTVPAIADFDTAIAQRAQSHPDFPLFQALPGAGPVVALRLLIAFVEQRKRYAATAELQKYAGIAPVTERSGTKAWVHWRLQCPKCLRPTFVAWVAESIRHSFSSVRSVNPCPPTRCPHQPKTRSPSPEDLRARWNGLARSLRLEYSPRWECSRP